MDAPSSTLNRSTTDLNTLPTGPSDGRGRPHVAGINRPHQPAHPGTLRLAARRRTLSVYHVRRTSVAPNFLRLRRRVTVGPQRTRHYTRLKAFGPAHGHYERTLQPGERSERTYWHHGSPDENALWRRRRALQVAAQNSRGGVRDARSHWEELLFTLRRSRGAAGRYQGTTGAAWAAAGVPRRPTDGSDGCPGGGTVGDVALEIRS